MATSRTTMTVPSVWWSGAGDPPSIPVIVTRNESGQITNIESAQDGIQVQLTFTAANQPARVNITGDPDLNGGAIDRVNFNEGSNEAASPSTNGDGAPGSPDTGSPPTDEGDTGTPANTESGTSSGESSGDCKVKESGSSDCEEETGSTVEWEACCDTGKIKITGLNGGGPLYKFYREDGSSAGQIVYRGPNDDDKLPEVDARKKNSNDLYLVVESCGCCVVIEVDCPGTSTSTSTTSTTPKVTTTPGPTTTPKVTTTPGPTTTPCCPPAGPWFWDANSSVSSTGESGAQGETGAQGESGFAGAASFPSAIVSVTPNEGIVEMSAGEFEIDYLSTNPESGPFRYVVNADGESQAYYPDSGVGGESRGVVIQASGPWSIQVESLTVHNSTLVNPDDEDPYSPQPPGGTTITAPTVDNVFTTQSTKEIQALVSGLTPSNETREMFLGYGNNINPRDPVLVRNASFWGSDIKGITGISPLAHWPPPYRRTRKLITHGVAITPRHVLISEHTDHPSTAGMPLTEIYFVTREGEVVKRTILGAKDAPRGTDWNISVLDEDLPDTIEVLKILPEDLASIAPESELEFGYRIWTLEKGWHVVPHQSGSWWWSPKDSLIWGTDQEEKGIIFKATQLGVNIGSDGRPSSLNLQTNLNSLVNQEWNEPIEKNDSSSPWFFVVNNEAILTGTATTKTSGPLAGGTVNTQTLNTLINDADDKVLGFHTGYTVTNANFTLPNNGGPVHGPPTSSTTTSTTTPQPTTSTTSTTSTTRTPNYNNPFTGSRPEIQTTSTTSTTTPMPGVSTTPYPQAPPPATTTTPRPATTTTPRPATTTTLRPVTTTSTTPQPIVTTTTSTTSQPEWIVTTTPRPATTTTPRPVTTTSTTPSPTPVSYTGGAPMSYVSESQTATTVSPAPPFVDLGSALSQPVDDVKAFEAQYLYDPKGLAIYVSSYNELVELKKAGYTNNPPVNNNYGLGTTPPPNEESGYGGGDNYSAYNMLPDPRYSTQQGLFNQPQNIITPAVVNAQRTGENSYLIQGVTQARAADGWQLQSNNEPKRPFPSGNSGLMLFRLLQMRNPKSLLTVVSLIG